MVDIHNILDHNFNVKNVLIKKEYNQWQWCIESILIHGSFVVNLHPGFYSVSSFLTKLKLIESRI